MSTDHFQGKPIKPDVERLLKEVNASPGGSATQDGIASILDLNLRKPKDRRRFETVTRRWRKELLRTRRIDTRGESRQIKFLDASQALHQGRRGVREVARRTTRLKHRIDLGIDPRKLPTEDEKKGHTLLVREVHALADLTAKTVKAVAVPRDAGGMPRPDVEA
jgi:hypothetical protein